MHHPPTVKAQREAKQAKWDREWMEKAKANLAMKDRQAELERRSRAYDAMLALPIGKYSTLDIRQIIRDIK